MNYQDLFSLRDRVAVVTGASKGIGRAIAEAMAAAGAKVVISSRKGDACEDVAGAINAAGGEAIAFACNIAHKSDLQGLVDRTLEHWGRIDTLVCNAAVNPYFGPLAEIPDDAYDKTMNVNLRSNLWLCNMVIPQMATRGGGAVVLVSSIAGLKGHDKLGERAEVGVDRGVADQRVDPAPVLESAVDQALQVALVGDVAGECDGFAAGRVDGAGDVLASVALAARDHHLGAGGGHGLGDGAADALGGAGHHRDPVPKREQVLIIHSLSLRICSD